MRTARPGRRSLAALRASLDLEAVYCIFGAGAGLSPARQTEQNVLFHWGGLPLLGPRTAHGFFEAPELERLVSCCWPERG